MNRLQRHGLRVLNPLDLSWSQESQVRKSLDLIDQCDAVLANLMRSGYGTAMEIFYAHRQGKAVTVVGSSPFNPWVLSHSQAHFEGMEEALEYLIGQRVQIDPLSWALQYEGLLCHHYEQFPADGEPDYQFLGGELPVLVVAPHATGHFRDGEFQEAAAFTGSTAALLHRLSRCHGLLSYYCCAADPWWHLETPLRRAYTDIVRAGQVGLVLFLTGAPWHEAPGLQLGSYDTGSGVAAEYAHRLRLKLSALEPVPSDLPEAQESPLLRFTAEELGVPALVLRLHKRYRMPRLSPEPYLQLMQALDSFVYESGMELLRSSA